MPDYANIPSEEQWKKDLGLSSTFGNPKSPFPAVQRLSKLIDAYHHVTGNHLDRIFARFSYEYYMYLQCNYILKNNPKGADYAKEKMGGVLSAAQVMRVDDLLRYVIADLMLFLNCPQANLDAELVQTFGKDVTSHGKEEDVQSVQADAIHWYQTDGARQLFKLAFRGGIAHKYDYQGAGKGNLVVYDTAAFGDDLEFHGALYVLDQRGRIYASGREGERTLKHSSFMAGQATLCAGTIRFDNGRLIWVSGRSGHYQPTVGQMVTLLERLRSYQVDLSKVIVYRENDKPNFQALPGAPCKFFEGCKAMDLLTKRAWPTGVSPLSMKVT